MPSAPVDYQVDTVVAVGKTPELRRQPTRFDGILLVCKEASTQGGEQLAGTVFSHCLMSKKLCCGASSRLVPRDRLHGGLR